VPAMLCLHPRGICTAAGAAPILLAAAAIIQCAALPQPTLCPPPKCILMCTHPHRAKRMRARRPAAGFAPAPYAGSTLSRGDSRSRPCAMQTPPGPPLRMPCERPPPEQCKMNERATPLVSHLPPALVHPCTAATTLVATARDVMALNACHANARPPNEYAPPGR
jgi:hypothetical protein